MTRWTFVYFIFWVSPEQQPRAPFGAINLPAYATTTTPPLPGTTLRLPTLRAPAATPRTATPPHRRRHSLHHAVARHPPALQRARLHGAHFLGLLTLPRISRRMAPACRAARYLTACRLLPAALPGLTILTLRGCCQPYVAIHSPTAATVRFAATRYLIPVLIPPSKHHAALWLLVGAYLRLPRTSPSLNYRPHHRRHAALNHRDATICRRDCAVEPDLATTTVAFHR